MFVIGAIEKVIKSKYSYNNKATKIELKNTIISLPIKNGKIDFNFMEKFITDLENKLHGIHWLSYGDNLVYHGGLDDFV